MRKIYSVFKIIESENGVVDVEYNCHEEPTHQASLSWCEENCSKYYHCQRVADANDELVENNC